MKCKAYLAVILAAMALFALTACGQTQPPAASDQSAPAAQQPEQQTVPETSEAEDAPASEGEASEEEPRKAALAKDLFEKYGVLPEYYEDLGSGIYQVYV